jgi:hypothetical protein
MAGFIKGHAVADEPAQDFERFEIA